MTSEHPMLGMIRKALATGLAITFVLGGPGCQSKKDALRPPTVLIAPYDASNGEVLWAVVPLRNESGTSTVDPLAVSDEVVAAIQQTRGVRCLPLNRTIAAMRALQLSELATPAEADMLATAMGVDGLIVGSVTAYDPYTPIMGVSLALYARPGPMFFRDTGASLDTQWLTHQPTDYSFFPGSTYDSAPASVVSEHLDGENHQTILDIQRYADGRHDPDKPYGWRRYKLSMALFTKFAAHQAVDQLLQHEWLRLTKEMSREVAMDG